MTQLSIVIPATGTQKDFDQTLVSVLENRPPDCEVIVPHALDYQDPYDLSDEVTFVGSHEDDLVSLFNAGIRTADGVILHLLQSGVRVPADWTSAPLDQLRSEPDLSVVSPLLIDPERPKRVLAVGLRYRNRGSVQLVGSGAPLRRVGRKRLSVDGPLLQASFFRTERLRKVGMLRNAFGEALAAADLASRLKQQHLRCSVVTEHPLIGWPVYQPVGFQAAKSAEQLFWHHARLTDPTPLLGHLGHVVWDLASQLPQPRVFSSALGRLAGLLAPRPQGDTTTWSETESAASDADVLSIEAARQEIASSGQNDPANGKRDRKSA